MKIIVQTLLLIVSVGLLAGTASAENKLGAKAVAKKGVFLGEDGKIRPLAEVVLGAKGDSSENPCCTNSEGTPCLGQCRGCRKWCSGESVASIDKAADKITP